MSVPRASCLLFLFALVVSVGCGPQDEITTNTVVRVEEPRRPVDVAAVKQKMQHTLVAILPTGEVAWFFKVSGPAARVEAVKDEFVKFIGTLQPSSEKKSPPTWKLPEGWQEKGPAAMRAATLTIPVENGEVEVAVSSLPLSGEWDDFLYRNVQRWQGQIEQDALPLKTIQEIAKEVSSEAGTSTVLHFVGRPSKSDRPNPHAGMAMTPQSEAPEKKETKKQETPNERPRGPLKYETPAGWSPGRMSMMRKAAFDVVDGKQRAEVTVISFPTNAGPMMTDPVANVQRWAAEVGIQGLDAAAIDELSKEIEVDGIQGIYVELLAPEEAERPKATLAAMVTREDQIWFYKLHGDQDLVQQQQGAFQAFLESVSHE